jgi:membrane-associated phospholipid phosphatase
VAAYRMINNKHWQSDVVAGAGFGILSAHLAYLTHRYRWGQRPKDKGTAALHIAPLYYAGATGLTLQWQLR